MLPVIEKFFHNAFASQWFPVYSSSLLVLRYCHLKLMSATSFGQVLLRTQPIEDERIPPGTK